MTRAAVAFDVFETFDIARNFALEVAFDFHRLDNFAYRVLLLRRDFFCFDAVADFGLVENRLSARTTDAVQSGERYFDSFIVGKGDTQNTHKYKNKTQKTHYCVLSREVVTLTYC